MKDLDKLDQLPKKEGRKAYLTRKYKNMYNLPKFDHPWYVSDKQDSVYFIKQIILKKYLGKSFDGAFSEFCKRVPVYEQHSFLEEFTARRWRDYADYLIDENGNIQFNPDGFAITYQKYKKNYQKPIVFTSIDYKEGYINKRTKKVEENRSWIHVFPDNYVKVILSGYKRVFESKKDPEYIRLMAEKRKQLKLIKKLNKKEQKKKQYSFLTKEEQEKLLNKSN